VNAYFFLIAGALMIFLEFFVPGMVIGALGIVLVAASVVFFAMQTTSTLYLLLYVAAVVIFLIAVFKLAVWRIRSSKSFFATEDQAGTRAGGYDAKLIHCLGVAETDLRPAGWVTIQGQTLQAMSQGDFIAKGTSVVVTGGEGSEIIVKPIAQESPL
jgi:membrane-bound serine protease (ClpP class)